MKKNMLIGLTICAVMTATSLTALAADSEPVLIAPAPATDEIVLGTPKITVDGEDIDFSKNNLSQYIFETNGNVMVPLRAVAEKMGFKVDWDGERQAVTVGNNDWETVIYIGKDSYVGVSKIAIGMTAPQSYGAAPQLVEDTTFVPAKMFEIMDYSFDSVGQFVNFRKITADENNVQIPNPFIPYENIDAAKKALSFNPSVPTVLPEGYNIDEITVMDNNFLQIVYKNDKDETIRYRIAKSSEDISGDYNTYANEKRVTIGNYEVTVRGNENISGAIWSSDDISYSILSDKELSEKEINNIIQSL